MDYNRFPKKIDIKLKSVKQKKVDQEDCGFSVKRKIYFIRIEHYI